MSSHEDNPPLERPPAAPEPVKLSEVRRTPDAAIIRLLEHELERARRGETSGIVIILTAEGHGVTNHWAGSWPMAETLLAVEMWKHEMLEHALGARGD